MESVQKENGLNAMNTVALKIKQRNEKIWFNEAHIKYVTRNINQLNSEIRQMEDEIKELDEDNSRNETYIKQVCESTEMIKSTLKTTWDSIGYMSDYKRLLREENNSIRLCFSDTLTDCRKKFAEHKTTLESTNALYKEAKDLTIRKKLLDIRVLDLKQKIENQMKINAQHRKIQSDLWHRDVIRFAKACLGYNKAKHVFQRLKAAEAEERQLIKKVLDTQRKIKEKKAMNFRSSTVRATVSFSDFSTCFSTMEANQISQGSCNIQQLNLEDMEQQSTALFPKPVTTNNLPTINFEIPAEQIDEQLAGSQPAFSSVAKHIELNPNTNKVRILDVVDVRPKQENLVKLGSHYISKKILRAAEKIRRKSTFSNRSCSQNSIRKSQNHNKSFLSQEENLSQSSAISDTILTPMKQNVNDEAVELNKNSQTVSNRQQMVQNIGPLTVDGSKEYNKHSSQNTQEQHIEVGRRFTQSSDEFQINCRQNIPEGEKASQSNQNPFNSGSYETSQILCQEEILKTNNVVGSVHTKPLEKCFGSTTPECSQKNVLMEQQQNVQDPSKTIATLQKSSHIETTNIKSQQIGPSTCPNESSAFLHRSNEKFIRPHLPHKRSQTVDTFGTIGGENPGKTQVDSSHFFQSENPYMSLFNFNENQPNSRELEKENMSFNANNAAQEKTQFMFSGMGPATSGFNQTCGLDNSADLSTSFLEDMQRSPPMCISSPDDQTVKRNQDASCFGLQDKKMAAAPDSNKFTFGISSLFNMF